MPSIIDATVALLTDNSTKKNTPALLRTVLTTLARLGANDRVGGLKSVLYLTQAEAVAAGRTGAATLDQLDPLSCCTGTIAYVDLPPTGTSAWRVLVYDDRPAGSTGQVNAYFDGAGTRNYNISNTGLASLKWVEKDSPAEAVARLRRWTGSISNWAADETMKIELAGADYFFSALQAGGPFAAPTAGGVATADWRPGSGPLTPGGSLLLDFQFVAGNADYFDVLIGNTMAATYTTQQATNAQSVSFLRNGGTVGLPIVLVAGDVLRVQLTRVNVNLGAVVTLSV